ncbi:uncharacterized protein A4U43_C04F33420 [Asparagus officinalis]|uniref:Uncharacterized protein n=1 Tax=Asparagus officinalis TaxID=4686 RepID=A0A5P1FAR4_ASPOF|nr:uncharacterized protein A4U43_C04F33420 [Asparagus officinalis]
MESPSQTFEVTVDDDVDGNSSTSMETSASFNVVKSIRLVDDGVDGESTTSVEVVKSMKLMLMREQRRLVEVDSVEVNGVRRGAEASVKVGGGERQGRRSPKRNRDQRIRAVGTVA